MSLSCPLSLEIIQIKHHSKPLSYLLQLNNSLLQNTWSRATPNEPNPTRLMLKVPVLSSLKKKCDSVPAKIWCSAKFSAFAKIFREAERLAQNSLNFRKANKLIALVINLSIFKDTWHPNYVDIRQMGSPFFILCDLILIGNRQKVKTQILRSSKVGKHNFTKLRPLPLLQKRVHKSHNRLLWFLVFSIGVKMRSKYSCLCV